MTTDEIPFTFRNRPALNFAGAVVGLSLVGGLVLLMTWSLSIALQ
jgi:hypothetical protein